MQNSVIQADSLVVLDFETTGLSPNQGDRAIEIGAVRIENGQITERFQELMNPGFRISRFIEGYTGITNAMLREAAPCAEVMHRFVDFIDDDNLVAHNASFDSRFLDAELERIDRGYPGQFACSLLVARRLYQAASSHKLGNLVDYIQLPVTGRFHRALSDAEMTANLWLAMLDEIRERSQQQEIPFTWVQKLSKTSKRDVNRLLASFREA